MQPLKLFFFSPSPHRSLEIHLSALNSPEIFLSAFLGWHHPVKERFSPPPPTPVFFSFTMDC